MARTCVVFPNSRQRLIFVGASVSPCPLTHTLSSSEGIPSRGRACMHAWLVFAGRASVWLLLFLAFPIDHGFLPSRVIILCRSLLDHPHPFDARLRIAQRNNCLLPVPPRVGLQGNHHHDTHLSGTGEEREHRYPHTLCSRPAQVSSGVLLVLGRPLLA